MFDTLSRYLAGRGGRPIQLARPPLYLASAGWLVLVVASLSPSIPTPPYLPPLFWTAAALAGLGGTVALLIAPTSERLVLLLAITTVIAIARSGAYIVSGAWSPLGVWLIVVALTLGHVMRPHDRAET
jgi:4-amino-4-deoxy-L-arabinose transferase-like glycosyltransferase